MKKLFVGLASALACAAVVLTMTAARRAPTIRANVDVAGVPMGGLTLDEAERKLRVWWEEVKLRPLQLHSDKIAAALPDMRPSELGFTLDDVASVTRLPTQDTFGDVKAAVTQQDFPEQSFDPVLRRTDTSESRLETLIAKIAGKPKPARVAFYKGEIVRVPEVVAASVDEAALADGLAKSIVSDEALEVPLRGGTPRISAEQLAEISEVVSSYTTHFPLRQYNRNSNIRLASSHLNGVILMPGEQMSFNQTVGQRTVKRGFKLAGVYKNGKHDTGIGGGICQVSTTLYNAALLGDLKIVRRSNHSMPVAYVPLGRDATVDYGSLDLVVQNDFPTPVAISSEFKPGSLTFRVLGKMDPGRTVKIIQVGGRSWDQHVEIVHDPHLKPGAKAVVERGSRGHSIRTYRLIYENGVLARKEPLGYSYYGDENRIIAFGPQAPSTAVPPGIPGGNLPAPRSGNAVVNASLGHR